MPKKKTAQKKQISMDMSRVINANLEQVMHQSMIPYSEYVILDRALPRVEDGLKPVQRRILYAMYELGLTPDKPYRKCARIVGDTLGKYHPHGDTSVYDALARMAQPFNMRERLVDGQGNYGSVDGDPPAAMRYTEARMTEIALEMLKDIDKDTVPFSLNFDDTTKEPDLLPARFPNLLVNGASGIAVGFATNIPTHNLAEVIDGIIAQMEDPNITVDELMRYVPGPDFPTGGIIIDNGEIRQAYETGRGRIRVRARVSVEKGARGKKLLVITELPYQTNKASLLKAIEKLSEDRKEYLSGISDIRDESDKTGMRAVIELRADADEEKILAYLYRYSGLEATFGANMIAVADGKPMQLGLKSMNNYYIRHRRDVITRRTAYELEAARAREHILAGLMIAVMNIDEVIRIIRASKNPAAARTALMERFSLTQTQAQAILDIRLARLTALELEQLRAEWEDIKKLIVRLEKILSDAKTLDKLVVKELLEMKKKYESPRRTTIEAPKEEAVIEKQEKKAESITAVLAQDGYLRALRPKDRASAFAEAPAGKLTRAAIDTETMQKLFVFTDKAEMYNLRTEDIPFPAGKGKEWGLPVSTLCGGFADGENCTVLMKPVSGENSELIFVTERGMLKITAADEYDVRKSHIAAMKLRDGDSLIYAAPLDREQTLLLVTEKGLSINIVLQNILAQGRVAGGVRAMKLDDDDKVIFASLVNFEGEIYTVTERGYAKRSLLIDYEPQNRDGKGVKTFSFRKTGSNGAKLISAGLVREPFDLLLTDNLGHSQKINTEELPIEDRAGFGRLVAVPEGKGYFETGIKIPSDKER